MPDCYNSSKSLAKKLLVIAKNVIDISHKLNIRMLSVCVAHLAKSDGIEVALHIVIFFSSQLTWAYNTFCMMKFMRFSAFVPVFSRKSLEIAHIAVYCKSTINYTVDVTIVINHFCQVEEKLWTHAVLTTNCFVLFLLIWSI